MTPIEPLPAWFLDRKSLKALGLAQRAAYRAARPFPHAVFDGFLGDRRALALSQRFPGPEHGAWMRRDYREQSARLGQLQRSGFRRRRSWSAPLHGRAFGDFLAALTGIEGLIADPHFRGAGPALTLPGGHLALHADFNRDRTRHLQRKLTVIYYLGLDWQPAWGGALELWDEPRTRCDASYLPLLDRLIVMDHGDTYWHGHPQPLACPDGRFRASVSRLLLRRRAVARGKTSHTERSGQFEPREQRGSHTSTPATAAPFRLGSELQAIGASLAPTRAMTISITGLVVLLIVAGICGGIGRAIGGGTGGGFFVSIAVGFVGALLGTFVAHYFHLPRVVDGHHRQSPVPDPVVDHRRLVVRGIGASCLGRVSGSQLALPLSA
ncbi:MAG: 2OG-Fe(II) oxygenase [Pseudomonadota bacterium]